VEQQRPLGKGRAPVVLIHLWVHVAVHFHQIQPSIVVVVQEAVAPTDKRNRSLRNACFVAHIGKAGVAVVVVENLVVVAKVGDKEIHLAVVLIVAGGNAHGGNFAPILVQREARFIALIVEGSIAFVDVEIIRFGVVAYQQVGFPVPFERNEIVENP